MSRYMGGGGSTEIRMSHKNVVLHGRGGVFDPRVEIQTYSGRQLEKISLKWVYGEKGLKNNVNENRDFFEQF